MSLILDIAIQLNRSRIDGDKNLVFNCLPDFYTGMPRWLRDVHVLRPMASSQQTWSLIEASRSFQVLESQVFHSFEVFRLRNFSGVGVYN